MASFLTRISKEQGSYWVRRENSRRGTERRESWRAWMDSQTQKRTDSCSIFLEVTQNLRGRDFLFKIEVQNSIQEKRYQVTGDVIVLFMPFLTNSLRSNLIMQPAPVLWWKKKNYLLCSSEARTASLRKLLDIQRTFVSHTWFWVLFCLSWIPSQNGYSCVHRVGAQKAFVELI